MRDWDVPASGCGGTLLPSWGMGAKGQVLLRWAALQGRGGTDVEERGLSWGQRSLRTYTFCIPLGLSLKYLIPS